MTRRYFISEEYREACRHYWEKQEGRPLLNAELEERIWRLWMDVNTADLTPLPKGDAQ